MRSVLRIGLVLAMVVVSVAVAGVRIQAWNPATHIYIAQKVYPTYAASPDLVYGAIAPDLAMYVPEGFSWDSAFWDTHWIAIDLRPWAWNAAQRNFAKGWFTHNEMLAADKFAHGNPPLYLAGYITLRANLLAAYAQIDPNLAHMAIETAVDLRLNNDHPEANLASWALSVAATPPSSAQVVLTRALVWWPLQRTDFQTLMAAQSTFDYVVQQYAVALGTSTLQDYDPIVTFGLALASQIDPSIEEARVRQLLAAALAMTADYQAAVDLTIKGVKLVAPR